jgi:hypothetical protein
MALLSLVHELGKSSLSLDENRFGESKRVPFSLSSPTYTLAQAWNFDKIKRLPSLLTVGKRADAPGQLIIFSGFPEGEPVRKSVLISQRLISRSERDSLEAI